MATTNVVSHLQGAELGGRQGALLVELHTKLVALLVGQFKANNTYSVILFQSQEQEGDDYARSIRHCDCDSCNERNANLGITQVPWVTTICYKSCFLHNV